MHRFSNDDAAYPLVFESRGFSGNDMNDMKTFAGVCLFENVSITEDEMKIMMEDTIIIVVVVVAG